MTKLKAFWANLSSPVKSGLATATWTFIALFGASLLGFLGQVTTWANGGGTFPSVSPLGKAAVSAIAAAGAGLVALVVRLAQKHTKLIPGNPPEFNPPAK